MPDAMTAYRALASTPGRRCSRCPRAVFTAHAPSPCSSTPPRLCLPWTASPQPVVPAASRWCWVLSTSCRLG